MLNSKLNKFKKIFCGITLCFGVFLSAFIGLINTVNIQQIYANTNNNGNGGHIVKDVSESLLGSEFNFNNTKTSYPISPSNWSQSSTKGINSEGENLDDKETKDILVKGIVNVKETEFSADDLETSWPKNIAYENQNDAFYKNLMINAHSESASYGYKSKSVNLESNSFYSIKVKLYTHKVDNLEPTASIYLTGLIDEKNDEEKDYYQKAQFTSITTLNTFDTYTFFISTSDSKTINIELWLGEMKTPTKGAVFFNEVNVTRYSEAAYITETATFQGKDVNNTEEYKTRVIDLKEEYEDEEQFFSNANFEQNLNDSSWKQIANNSTKDNFSSFSAQVSSPTTFEIDSVKETIPAPGSNCSVDNIQSMLLYNKNESYQAVESPEFNISRHGYYKITFWAKSNCNTGNGATVKLVDKSINPIDPATISTSTTSSKDSNTFRNDWTEYNFYIYGSGLENKKVTIQVWLGTEESKTNGYVFVDDFRIQKIDYSTFSSKSSSNVATLNFNSDKSTFGITNGTFDVTLNEEKEVVYPLTPSSWTNTNDVEYNTYSGIIPTDVNLPVIGTINNIPNINENNNVLVIGSTNETNTQVYKSSSLNLSATSYYKISFYSMSNVLSENNGKVRVRLSTSNITLFDYYIDYENNTNWTKKEIYIKTDSNAYTANIELMVEKINGYIFFDDVKFETVSEPTFNNPPLTSTTTSNPSKVDLTSENFTNGVIGKDISAEEIVSPYNWTISDESIKGGIIALPSDIITDIDNTISGNTNVLYLSSANDSFTTFTSKQTYTFTAQNYYKISINILTRNIAQETKEDNIKYGASFGLSSDNKLRFTGIDNNTWKTYTLYLCPESDITSSIVLAIGNTDEITSGEVLFDNLKIQSIDADIYKNELNALTDETLAKSFINYVKEEETTPEEESTWENEFNWLIIPSLLTGLAIIIAVVGFYFRKITIAKKPKIKTKYDRRKTLDLDISKKEKIALRHQIISELNDELQSIDKEIEEYKALASQQLEEIKTKINEEKEELKRRKIEIEIKKKESTAEREKQLKADPTFNSNKKAEKEYIAFISKLDKQELSLQKQISATDLKLENTKDIDQSKLNKFYERKEFIKNEIAKIEAEILEITREDDEMWAEYKQAKEDAKKRKKEYKEQVKFEKEKASKTTVKSPAKTTSKKASKKASKK